MLMIKLSRLRFGILLAKKGIIYFISKSRIFLVFYTWVLYYFVRFLFGSIRYICL
ncbi:hypothetical protein NC652_016806 [Populus alba x Populus x berolinensis]|uniref:Uncharacterized protein n=1 Tax=Populus alba x Populus x berolinensis TaxID=444605 RepID=A0AAD6VZR8_9ROSI|nr:hypothetical protein NC652_016806 [Populus alba x Populus x berolinensis]KAJ6993707.1 hypothetical protein NC653_016750 [Populus alba x Populus x berolinensis]